MAAGYRRSNVNTIHQVGNPAATRTSGVSAVERVLSRRSVVVRRIAAASALAFMASVPFAMQNATAQNGQDVSTQQIDESKFVELINKERAAKGAGPLTVHVELVRVARTWTQRMKSDGDISHNPNLAKEVNASWRKLGENVGVGPEVDMLHTAFVQSPAHYKNIVDPAFDHIGVTIEYAEDVFYVTEQFMDLDDRTVATTAKPPLPTNSKAPEQLALQKKPVKKAPVKKAPAKKVPVKKTTTK
jgi:uncharacterized protein YkwD